MQDIGDNARIQPIELSLPRHHPDIIRAPRDYFLGPVFAATKQSGPREVTVRVRIGEDVSERRYQIGGFHPMDPDLHPPALDVRHARAIFSLLSFRTEYDDTRLIRFSFNEFCRKYAQSNGGRYARAIRKIVRDLLDSYIRVTDVKTDIAHQYRLIERIDIESRPPRRRDAKLARSPQREMWFNGCTLSPEFAGLLSRVAELHELNLDVFNSIRAPLAQAIYLYIPSRAYHYHSEDNPFEITLTNLLQQVSARVPQHKSRRKELFTKNNNPILKQLDGLKTLSGIFRVKLAETTDGTDWKLQTWVERAGNSERSGWANTKVLAAYLRSGRPRSYFEQAVSNIQPLSDYDIELLTAAKVEVGKNRRFFEIARALLKPYRFSELLAEAKGDEIEGRKARKGQAPRLIHRIMQAIETPPQRDSEALQ
jgi:hypothetical protein